MPGIDRRPSGAANGSLSPVYVDALGKVTETGFIPDPSGPNIAIPTLFNPESTVWSDDTWFALGWPCDDGAYLFLGQGNPGALGEDNTLYLFKAHSASSRAAQIQGHAYADDLSFVGFHLEADINPDGTGSVLSLLANDTSTGALWEVLGSPTALTMTLIGVAGQTNPILDVQDNNSVSLFNVKQVGGTTAVISSVAASAIHWFFSAAAAGSGGFDFINNATATTFTIVGSTGQTDPVLDIQSSAGSIFTMGPDGSVGGVTPASAYAITWNGTNYVATNIAALYDATGAAAAAQAYAIQRSNHTGSQSISTLSDAFDATAPTTQAVGDAAAVGTATTAPHRDHKHAWPSGAQFMASLTSTNAAVFSFNAQRVANVADPTNVQDVATKNYVDTTGGGWTVVKKAADEIVNNSTTLQNDDHLLFTAAAGVGYEVECALVYADASGATPDLKCAFGEDGTARGSMHGFGLNASDTAAAQNAGTQQSNGLIFGTSATKRTAISKGTHMGAGGTFRLLWAQNTANVSSTTVYTGSWLRYRTIV